MDVEPALPRPGKCLIVGSAPPASSPCENALTSFETTKRLVEKERCAYLRPWVIHCQSPDATIANTEYMFPYVTVIECPQEQMIEKIGQTLVATAITNEKNWARQLTSATNIDRLNIGPIPTTKLDWLQPHEGNIVDFLFRARAFQIPQERLAGRA